MAVRWRADGTVVCAAMRPEEPGDTYIDDRLHYELSVIQRVLIADPKHEDNALWHWLHGARMLRGAPEIPIRATGTPQEGNTHP